MTSLLERLEHLLHIPLHRAPGPQPTSGFLDCRGEWHFWDEE